MMTFQRFKMRTYRQATTLNTLGSGECSVPRAVDVTVYVRTEISTKKFAFSDLRDALFAYC